MNCGLCGLGKATLVRGPLPAKWGGVKLKLKNIERFRCPVCHEEFFNMPQCRALDAARKQAYSYATENPADRLARKIQEEHAENALRLRDIARRDVVFDELREVVRKELSRQVEELNRVKNVYTFHENGDTLTVYLTETGDVLTAKFCKPLHTVWLKHVGKVVFERTVEVHSTPNSTFMCWGYGGLGSGEPCDNSLPSNRVVDFVREAVNALI
jgi:hypothetical protein